MFGVGASFKLRLVQTNRPRPNTNTMSSHPPYAKMIVTAIAALKDRTGSSLQAIKKAIGAAYPALSPASVSKATTASLKKMVAAGTVNQTKGSYKLSAKTKDAAKKPVAKKKPAAKKTAAKKTAAKKKPAAKKSTAKKMLVELGVDKETRAKFAQENLTPESLIEFSNEEFRELGINAGLRYRIRQRSAEVIKDEDYSSAPCPDYLTELPENLTTAATGPKHPEPRGGRKCYVDVGFEGVCAWHAKR